MQITIAICTWNRARLLERTLAQMQCLVIPPGVKAEILVVNNNCTDNTDEVIAQHRQSLPIHALFEPTPGKSFAANRAVQEARGDLILWTDDDVLVDPLWVDAYLSAATRWPQAAYFGGVIEPWFEATPPGWIANNLKTLGMAYALNNHGEISRPFREDEMPFGANMAIRKKAFESVSFDSALGPSGNNQVRGEETALIRQLKRQGHVGIWVSEAKVKHCIPSSRLTRKYVWRYCVGHGRTMARRNGVPRGKWLYGIPRWLVRQYYEHWLKSVWLRLRGSPDWVSNFTKAAIWRGVIAECVLQKRMGRLYVPMESFQKCAEDSSRGLVETARVNDLIQREPSTRQEGV
jgi:glycosyltransferase involved in cell wall biosynthesis